MKLEEEIGELLKAKNLSLSTAESCTGGGIAALITSVPGSSEYFNGGIVAYSNEIKQDLLHVSAETLARHGAVSRVDEAVDAVIDFLEFPAGGNEGGPDCVVGWEVLERVQQAAAHLHQRGIEFLGGVAGGGKRTLVIGGVFVQGFFQPEQGGVEF